MAESQRQHVSYSYAMSTVYQQFIHATSFERSKCNNFLHFNFVMFYFRQNLTSDNSFLLQLSTVTSVKVQVPCLRVAVHTLLRCVSLEVIEREITWFWSFDIEYTVYIVR